MTPSDSACARVLPVADTVASSLSTSVPPFTKASTCGFTVAVDTAPLSARPRPAAAATAWLCACMSASAVTESARTASPVAEPMAALPPMDALVEPPMRLSATEAPAT